MANDLEALRVHLGLSEISILGVLPIGFAPNSAVKGGTSPKQEEISNVERPIPLEAPVTLEAAIHVLAAQYQNQTLEDIFIHLMGKARDNARDA